MSSVPHKSKNISMHRLTAFRGLVAALAGSIDSDLDASHQVWEWLSAFAVKMGPKYVEVVEEHRCVVPVD